MDILEKLFGSGAKVKIMKLFLFHMDKVFGVEEIRKRSQVTVKSARKELNLLTNIGFLKKKSIFREKKSKGRSFGKKRVAGWIVNANFPYLAPLQSLLIYKNSIYQKDITKRLNNVGNLKLVIISGIFIQEWESRVDLLIVGDKLNRGPLQAVIKTLEAEMGRELRYTILETEDFLYRLNIYDKLLRDILDFPHEKILDRIDV